MNRTAMRLLALASLTAGGKPEGDPIPWPTLAADNVFDSQRDDIEVTAGERAPYIVIRTDDDDQQLAANGNTTNRKLTMRLEYGVLTGKRESDTGPLIVDWPRSDSALEAFLDLFDWQIQAALIGPTIWAKTFSNRFTPQTLSSVPLFVDVQEVPVRVAAREMTLVVDSAMADPMPPFQREGEPVWVPVLPRLLLDVFDIIETRGGGDLKEVAANLKKLLEAQMLPRSGVYPRFTSALGRFTEADATAPPTGEEPQPQVVAETLEQAGGCEKC